MLFKELQGEVEKYLHILEASNRNFSYTQLVIGGMHYMPRVQCDELSILDSLNSWSPIRLIGKEGPPIESIPSDIDIKKATKSTRHMRELLKKRINAVILFGNNHSETTVEAVDDPHLRELSHYIDSRCHELFLLKQKKGWQNMTEKEKRQYGYWFDLMKNILLGDRSDSMVKNLYDAQRDRDIQLSVLVCGAAHTPYRDGYRPYSVSRMLQSLPVNFIVAVVPSALPFINKLEPFDFYSKSDRTEVSPYSNTSLQ